MISRQSGQTPEARALEVVARCRALRARLRETGRFDVTLAARWLLLVGEQLRRGERVPAFARYHRRRLAREHLAALVGVMEARATGGDLDSTRCGEEASLRFREFLESVRVAVRWVCLARPFEPTELPGWAALSRAVWRFDEARAALHGGAGAEGGGVESGEVARGEGASASARWWEAVERYVRRGSARARVEGRAAVEPGFARMLERVVGRRGARVSEEARRWVAERRSAAALSRGWAAVPAAHGRGTSRAGWSVAPGVLRLLPSGDAPFVASPRATTACEACGAFYVAQDSGGVARLRPGEALSSFLRGPAFDGGISALQHVHPARAGAGSLLLMGTGLGVLHCVSDQAGHVEEVWRVHLEGWWARSGEPRPLRAGEPPSPPGSGSALDEITAIASWGGRAARGVVAATRRRALFVVRFARGGAWVRRLLVPARSFVRALLPVAGGLFGLTAMGELVKLPGSALRGRGMAELLRFTEPARAGGWAGRVAVAALDRQVAPALLFAGPREASLYDAEGGRLLRLSPLGTRAVCAATADLGGRRHVILGTAEGQVVLWDAEGLRACSKVGEAGCTSLEPSAELTVGSAEVAHIEVAPAPAGESERTCHVLVALGDGSAHLLRLEVGEPAGSSPGQAQLLPLSAELGDADAAMPGATPGGPPGALRAPLPTVERAAMPRDDVPESGARWSRPALDEIWTADLATRRG
ncbi:hypothetical protein [Chondromyces apiculatus]|uniref:Uncharacterized protein n=1 Tax=Chondromyces apiculatus DSM 436 TaxID=1192034 RepID=A0A017T4N0_9BACT|nr:hypothetical protein [Chondromyces apiculatus]EYF03957.1 Hypothetical protein CAP_5058 [Chondromyces apiculatus DSM 436]